MKIVKIFGYSANTRRFLRNCFRKKRPFFPMKPKPRLKHLVRNPWPVPVIYYRDCDCDIGANLYFVWRQRFAGARTHRPAMKYTGKTYCQFSANYLWDRRPREGNYTTLEDRNRHVPSVLCAFPPPFRHIGIDFRDSMPSRSCPHLYYICFFFFLKNVFWNIKHFWKKPVYTHTHTHT